MRCLCSPGETEDLGISRDLHATLMRNGHEF